MQTKEEVKAAFMAEFLALLEKYDAEIVTKNDWMEVTIPAIYNSDHDCVREWTEIDLGTSVYFKSK